MLGMSRGIEANPEKIAAMINMKPPSSRKQVQKLTGRLAALKRFFARLAKKAYHFLDSVKHRTF